ncbi:MAG: hypothetical protein A2075_24680 [Geobacteraceae bacterium GWC2_58_44]|nr:MAG: hypothetical protein A2075_24680 [Geobacteraceae bacterium GWC2_58_44]HBG04480.1 hypothetical protein [Geobacter sp.]
MSQLDDALVELRQDMDNPKIQSNYYDLFLNTTFFVPTMEEDLTPDQAAEVANSGRVAPLIIESGGNDYLVLFDSKERLYAWAKKEASYVEVPGHVLAATSAPPLHWALNMDTEYSKPFIPPEIAWLKDAVEKCNAEAAKQQEQQQ